MKTDEEIIREYLKGDELALNILIERHLKSVYNLAYAMVRSQAEAEDIAQETFVKLWKNIKKYRPGNNFISWLLTIARNTAYDYIRKRKNIPFSDFEDEAGNKFVENIVSDNPPANELIIQNEEKEVVQRMLEKLSLSYREVLVLRYSEELTFDEIGRILGKPLNTVKSQHRRALIELRQYLESDPGLKAPK